MTASAGALSLASDAPVCPQCARAMEPCNLEGHYGQQVPTDICPHCNLVWFDEFESVRLSGLGWVSLLRRMQAAMHGGAGPLRSQLDCPRCRGQLKPVSNLTRFGRFAALECPRRHGHLQTFSLLLAERGLVRPLAHADLLTLAREGREPCCLNCGGPLQSGTETCTFCASPLVVIDMPRLMAALLIRHAEPLPDETAQRVAWPCRGCGAPLAPNQTARCERCHHQVVVPSVLDLRPLLDKAEPLLREALPRAARPHGEKLKAMRGNPDATALHRYLRHVTDMADDESGTSGVSRWIAFGVFAAVIWYIWS
jgi:hypothetical protein